MPTYSFDRLSTAVLDRTDGKEWKVALGRLLEGMREELRTTTRDNLEALSAEIQSEEEESVPSEVPVVEQYQASDEELQGLVTTLQQQPTEEAMRTVLRDFLVEHGGAEEAGQAHVSDKAPNVWSQWWHNIQEGEVGAPTAGGMGGGFFNALLDHFRGRRLDVGEQERQQVLNVLRTQAVQWCTKQGVEVTAEDFVEGSGPVWDRIMAAMLEEVRYGKTPEQIVSKRIGKKVKGGLAHLVLDTTAKKPVLRQRPVPLEYFI